MDKEYTAWMIREDGTAIPCVQHIYGSPDCVEETLYAAEWLFKNTRKDETKSLILQFISSYAVYLKPDSDLVCNLLDKIQDQPYVTLTEEFIREIGGGLVKTEADQQELNRKICDELNKEFLRARLGGMYHTEEDNCDMYFRISSKNQDWKNMVRKFLARFEHPIDTITVVFDEESTGKRSFLHDADMREINHLPINCFELQ